mmetsp:Transcript_37091/g.88174  ORF Transcript_37091/g.88174 Transcript_37091/m.88174 type:complete len:504 (+) Transcript_37091:257-1768(+)
MDRFSPSANEGSLVAMQKRALLLHRRASAAAKRGDVAKHDSCLLKFCSLVENRVLQHGAYYILKDREDFREIQSALAEARKKLSCRSEADAHKPSTDTSPLPSDSGGGPRDGDPTSGSESDGRCSTKSHGRPPGSSLRDAARMKLERSRERRARASAHQQKVLQRRRRTFQDSGDSDGSMSSGRSSPLQLRAMRRGVRAGTGSSAPEADGDTPLADAAGTPVHIAGAAAPPGRGLAFGPGFSAEGPLRCRSRDGSRPGPDDGEVVEAPASPGGAVARAGADGGVPGTTATPVGAEPGEGLGFLRLPKAPCVDVGEHAGEDRLLEDHDLSLEGGSAITSFLSDIANGIASIEEVRRCVEDIQARLPRAEPLGGEKQRRPERRATAHSPPSREGVPSASSGRALSDQGCCCLAKAAGGGAGSSVSSDGNAANGEPTPRRSFAVGVCPPLGPASPRLIRDDQLHEALLGCPSLLLAAPFLPGPLLPNLPGSFCEAKSGYPPGSAFP